MNKSRGREFGLNQVSGVRFRVSGIKTVASGKMQDARTTGFEVGSTLRLTRLNSVSLRDSRGLGFE